MNDRTRAAYDAAFQAERLVEYPVMDALEARFGYKVDRDRLEDAARVLACPLKKNPPNWQHGRLVYALGRHVLNRIGEATVWLDVGTAKGFSAICMAWANIESDLCIGAFGAKIVSIDTIPPSSNEPRNSVIDGQVREGIWDYAGPFCGGYTIVFAGVGDPRHRKFLASPDRISLAFVDGSHTYEGVKADIETIAPRQQSGDIMLFDDMQVHGVKAAVVSELGRFGLYEIEEIRPLPNRIYAIAIRQ